MSMSHFFGAFYSYKTRGGCASQTKRGLAPTDCARNGRG